MQMELLLDPASSSPACNSSTGLSSIAVPGSSSLRTCPDSSAASRATTLQQWLATWQVWTKCESHLKAGERKALRLETTACSNGLLSTRNGSAWRSGAVACSLSSILETGPIDPRYFLSQK